MTNRAIERSNILFCNCVHYEIIPRASKERILAALSEAYPQIEVVDDLCGLAAQHDPRLPVWAQAPSLTIVACFPRAVRWLFHAVGISLPPQGVRLFNMRTQPPEEILRELRIEDKSVPSGSPNHQSTIINHQSTWVPWFPVIDYDRCQNCKQCLNFCLFGVYTLSAEGRVEVQKPAGCKTNCPACARLCPERAIIFPKYAEAPINGAELTKEDEANRPAPMPHQQLMERIRQRSDGHKRFATKPQESSPRPSCPTLDGLRRELGVPDDVLASLSPTELQRIMSPKSPGQQQSDLRPSDRGKDQEHHD